MTMVAGSGMRSSTNPSRKGLVRADDGTETFSTALLSSVWFVGPRLFAARVDGVGQRRHRGGERLHAVGQEPLADLFEAEPQRAELGDGFLGPLEIAAQ